MTTKAEKTPGPLIFVPPREDLTAVLASVADENQVLDAQKLTTVFVKLFDRTQRENAGWLEERLRTLRGGLKNPLIDGILVNREGRILHSWSTYQVYLTDEVVDLSVTALLGAMHKKGELLIPLTPQRDSANFWLEENEEQVLTAIQEHLPSPLEVEDYGEFSSTDFGFRRMADLRKIRMTRIQSGKMGDGKFAQRDIVRGRLGFWANSTPEGSSTYTPRVFIERSGIFPQQTYISPTPESEVLVRGGIPMNENHPNLQVLRTDPNLARQDFIIAALLKFSNSFKGTPFVLRFDTYKPWAGSYPHHG